MSITAMKMALEALEICNGAETVDGVVIYTNAEINTLDKAIAEAEKQEGQSNFCPNCEALSRELKAIKQEQGEPVVHESWCASKTTMLTCMPPRRAPCNCTPQPAQKPWVGLTDEDIRKTDHHMVEGAYHYSFKQGAEWAEAKLKEKNT